MWGQRICEDVQRKSKWPRGVAEDDPASASQNLEGKNGTPSKAAPRALSEERASTVWEQFKGKAANTAIKYSAPNRAILFSFYNYPQPLWVWADKQVSALKSRIYTWTFEKGEKLV